MLKALIHFYLFEQGDEKVYQWKRVQLILNSYFSNSVVLWLVLRLLPSWRKWPRPRPQKILLVSYWNQTNNLRLQAGCSFLFASNVGIQNVRTYARENPIQYFPCGYSVQFPQRPILANLLCWQWWIIQTTTEGEGTPLDGLERVVVRRQVLRCHHWYFWKIISSSQGCALR